ncbi:MAG: RNA methyltransferase [Actinomycetota bacterium]
MSRSSEGIVAGRRAAVEAVRAGSAREVLVAEGARPTESLRGLLRACREAGVPVAEVPRQCLDAFAADHRGVVVRLRDAPEMGERQVASWPFGDEDVVVVLDGVVDPQNLGAAARSAEAAGAVMLVSRLRRAAAPSPAAIRASAGALLYLPHARVANIARVLARLKDAGFWVVGLDEDASATVYAGRCPQGRVAVVLGSEGEGLSRLVREACDTLVSLPMHGRVGSLNASAALAAVLYAYVLPSRR